MKVLELFAGTRSIGKAFENRGHQVFSVEWDKNFENIDLYADILTVTTDEILNRFGRPDVIWASPDCSTFSIAAISHHRRKNPVTGNLDPVSDYAKFCDMVDQHVLQLIKDLNPRFWFIENPRGGMRKMSWMQGFPRYTVTYCQYGDTRMKPTDIWTNHPEPQFKPMCKNGDPCHERAPRSATIRAMKAKGVKMEVGGTQYGLKQCYKDAAAAGKYKRPKNWIKRRDGKIDIEIRVCGKTTERRESVDYYESRGIWHRGWIGGGYAALVTVDGHRLETLPQIKTFFGFRRDNMDAVKFIEERNRMCESFGDGCTGCPASNACKNELCCAFDQGSTLDATDQVAMVENWSAAHPRKTRQSVFLEHWPDADIDCCGVLTICPSPISTSHRNAYGGCANIGVKCPDCRREFWMQEVE